MTDDLATKKCAPCTEKTPRLDDARIAQLLPKLDGWSLRDGKLQRSISFKDFAAAMKFVDAMAKLAETEQHHPDFLVHGWNHVDVMTSTHAIHGLSENDFVLAAKINRLL